MTEWTTIRVRKSAKQAAEQRKPDGMTWSEYVASEEYAPVANTEELAREVARQLDYAEISTLVANEVEALRR